jgi:hypothetical protein
VARFKDTLSDPVYYIFIFLWHSNSAHINKSLGDKSVHINKSLGAKSAHINKSQGDKSVHINKSLGAKSAHIYRVRKCVLETCH